MIKLSDTEKSTFTKLFIRAGYVLNFSTVNFDVFTVASIGIALCEVYDMSKGKSLMEFISQASESDIIKLFKDLLEHYETYCHEGDDDKYLEIYEKCKNIMKKIASKNNTSTSNALILEEKFSNKYLSKQVDLMLKMQTENPTAAIGKAKELIESCCKTILDDNNIEWDKNWNVGKLADKTMELLHLMPKDIPDNVPDANTIKAILDNLLTIATNLAALRNSYGSGHDKIDTYKGLYERHAKLAVGSSITLVGFLWDTYDRKSE